MISIATITTPQQTIRLLVRSPENVPLDKKGTAPAGIRGQLAKVAKKKSNEGKALKDSRAIEAAATQLRITFKPLRKPNDIKDN